MSKEGKSRRNIGRIAAGFVILLLLINIIIEGEVHAQEITRENIPYKIVNTINSENDTMVDNDVYPSDSEKNDIVENTSVNIDTSFWNKEISELVRDRKINSNITDDGKTAFCFGLIKCKDNHIYIRRLSFKIFYQFGDIGGGYKIVRTFAVLDNDVEKVICLFKEGIVFDEKQVDLYPIGSYSIEELLDDNYPENQLIEKKLLDKNILVRLNFVGINYEIEHSASLCLNSFESKGSGSIYPTYYNVVLKLKNDFSKTEQVIFKTPHNCKSEIQDGEINLFQIMYGDINNDGDLDIIYTTFEGTIKKLIVFLSTKTTKGSFLKYIGYTLIYVIDP